MIERDLGTGSQLHCRLGLRAAFRSEPMGLGCMNNVTHDLVLCGELEGFFHFEQSSCSVGLCPATLECQPSICCPTAAPTVALETLEWVIPPEDDV